MNTFATFEGPGKSGARYVFKCKEVTTGRYVKVMIKGAEYLTLAEDKLYTTFFCTISWSKSSMMY
jgi:translation elongation factor P/translation initiation factor 5A